MSKQMPLGVENVNLLQQERRKIFHIGAANLIDRAVEVVGGGGGITRFDFK